MPLSTIIEKLKKKYGGLRSGEEESIHKEWQKFWEQKEVTVEKIKETLKMVVNSVEIELINPENSKEKDLFLKAQLKNAKIILGLIGQSERSTKEEEESFEKYIDNILKGAI